MFSNSFVIKMIQKKFVNGLMYKVIDFITFSLNIVLLPEIWKKRRHLPDCVMLSRKVNEFEGLKRYLFLSVLEIILE